MNLLIITRYYPPAIDGVGDHSRHLKTHFEQKGVSVKVFTVPQLSGYNTPPPYVITTPVFGPTMLPHLLQAMAQHGITHVLWQYVPNSYHRRGLPFYLPTLLKEVAATGVHQSIFFHEVALRPHGFGLRQWLKGNAQLRLARQINEVAQASFTSIPLYAAYFEAKVPSLVAIGANILPADAPPLPPPAAGPSLSPPTIFFCFTNRLYEAQFQALAYWQHQYDCLLVIAGKSDEAQAQRIVGWIQQYQLQSRVVLRGTLLASELATLLLQADAVLQPEKLFHQTMGGISAKNGTLAASWAFGKIVVASRGDMTDPSIFKDGQNCLLITENTAEQWTEAMGKILAMPKAARARMTLQIQHAYQQYFSWETIATQLLETLTNQKV